MIDLRGMIAGLTVLSGLLTLGPNALYGQAKEVGDKPLRHFYAEIIGYSVIPADPLNSFRRAGSLGASIGGTAGTSVHSKAREFKISATGKKRGESFFVELSITESDGPAKAPVTVVRELDLTDLHPETLQLDQDPDGRVYRLNVIPEIKEQPPAKLYRADELGLDEWSFADSAVIVNDQDYLGTLGMGGGNLASVQMPGLANIEFSLTPLTGSEPEGVLRDGIVTIQHGETTIVIRNVRIGLSDTAAKQTAFKVFVRWKEPTETLDEVRRSMKERLELIKLKRRSGEETFPQPLIERLERMLERDRVMLLGGGMRSVLPKEIDQARLGKTIPSK